MKKINMNQRDAKLLIVGACLGIVLKTGINKGIELLSDAAITKIINRTAEKNSFTDNEFVDENDNVRVIRDDLNKEDN